MIRPRRSARRAARRLSGTALLLSTTACWSWQVQSGPIPRTVDAAREAPVRVVLRDGRTLTLEEPRVEGDSLVGRSERGPAGQRLAAHMAEVVEIRTHRFDSGLTAAAVAIGALALGVVFYALVAAAYGGAGTT